MNIFKCIIIILPLGFAKNVGFSDLFFFRYVGGAGRGKGLPVGGREARERERREGEARKKRRVGEGHNSFGSQSWR